MLPNKTQYINTRMIWFQLKKLSCYDLVSGQHKLATIYLKRRRIDCCLQICCKVLQHISRTNIQPSYRIDKFIITSNERHLRSCDVSLLPNEFMSEYVSMDVMFSPLGIGLVPEAEQQEMIREKHYLYNECA